MNQLFDRLQLQSRPPKPRATGWTMVLDKSLGLHGAQDLVDTAGDYIDVVKLGWGSSALYPQAVLERKIQIFREHGIRVCAGGTFLEFAHDRVDLPSMLDLLRDTGFNAIEVSDGIHPTMTRAEKLHMIEVAVARGFEVVSEVGKKLVQEDLSIDNRRRIQEIKEDLAAGAQKVIIEARESGTVGIFRANGDINAELAYELFQNVDPDLLIWEAPDKNQQAWMLKQLGAHVSIGNVAPQDVISLESMRHGLRGDTFRDHCKGTRRVYLELGVAGAMRARQRGDLVVVVDAIRASTTIIRCLELGAREVIPVVSAGELRGEVTIGERGGSKLPFADFDNSPVGLNATVIRGKSVVITTTNGTECIQAAKGENNMVLVGGMTNASAVAQAAVAWATSQGCGISLVAAGRNNLPAIEDRSAVTQIMQCMGVVSARGTLEPHFSDNHANDFLDSDSGVNLVQLGHRDDVLYCAQKDVSSVVPVFDGHKLTQIQFMRAAA
jgi:phosphosulfolactate synthase (CoM biosynthesis protein A)/phosphosulfolactate phosphohydrolase-like enzyme